MENFVRLPDTEKGDLGGVHANSGIPNKAFFLTASRVGGFAWEARGLIWFESLKASNTETRFQEFANTTYRKAAELFGDDSTEQLAVLAAWQDAGIQISGILAGVARTRSLAADRNGGAGGDKGTATVSRRTGPLTTATLGRP